MEKRKTGGYIWLGLNIRYLLGVSSDAPLGGDGYVIENLVGLRDHLQRFNLKVTEQLVSELGMNELVERLTKATAEDPAATIGSAEAGQLKGMMSKIRDTALAEANTLHAYVVSDKRLDTLKLVDDPGALLPPNVFGKLSGMARLDFAEGCKCIAFERPTAAAFHYMRAVEEALRSFYLASVKQKRVSPLLWKAMTDQLAKRRSPPAAALLAQLDHIRANFRNPTQHPDAVYDIHEAQDLAFVTIDVLSRLVRAMP